MKNFKNSFGFKSTFVQIYGAQISHVRLNFDIVILDYKHHIPANI